MSSAFLVFVAVGADVASAKSGAMYCAADFNRDGIVGKQDRDMLLRFFPSKVSAKTRQFDLNGDRKIDGADLARVLAAYGNCRSCRGDITRDGAVDGADLGFVLANFGKVSSREGEMADLHKDYFVDALDLTLLLDAWGSCSNKVAAASAE